MSAQKRVIRKSLGSIGRPGLSSREKKSLKGTFQMQARRPGTPKKSRPLPGGVVVCEDCRAVWHDKHWHSPSVVEGMDLSGAGAGLCEECKSQRKGKAAPYAGEVTLDGEFSPQEKDEILGLVRNAGKRAMARNPEDRIVRIAESGGAIKVYTSLNQLAVAVGTQVHHARKGGELTITWSRTDKPVRVLWRKG